MRTKPHSKLWVTRFPFCRGERLLARPWLTMKNGLKIWTVFLMTVAVLCAACSPPKGYVVMGEGSSKSEMTVFDAYVVSDSTGAASVDVDIRNRICDTLILFPSMLTIKTNTGTIIHPDSLQSYTDIDDFVPRKATHRPEPESLARKTTIYIYAWFRYPQDRVTIERLNESGDLPLTLALDSVRCAGADGVMRLEATLSKEAHRLLLK